jgi:hypothetical protein
MNTSLIVVVIAALGVAACGTKEVRQTPDLASNAPSVTAVTSAIPSWYLVSSTTDSEVIIASGTGISRDLAMSSEKALLDAQRQIADRVAAEIDGLTKSYRQDAGSAGFIENTEQLVRKLVSDIQVGGYNITNKIVLPEGREYRTFIQLRYPMTELYRQTLRSRGSSIEMRGDAIGRELDIRKQLQRRSAMPQKSESAVITPIISTEAGIMINKSFSVEASDKAEEN